MWRDLTTGGRGIGATENFVTSFVKLSVWPLIIIFVALWLWRA